LDYGDWVIALLLTIESNLYYIPYISAVRRMNENSVWGMQNSVYNIERTLRTRLIIKELPFVTEAFRKKMEVYESQLIDKLNPKNRCKNQLKKLTKKIFGFR